MTDAWPTPSDDAQQWQQPPAPGESAGVVEPLSASGSSHHLDLAWLGPEAFDGSAVEDRRGPLRSRGELPRSSEVVFWTMFGLAATFLCLAVLMGLVRGAEPPPLSPVLTGVGSAAFLGLLVWARWLHHPVRVLDTGPSGFFVQRGKKKLGARWDEFRRVSLELSHAGGGRSTLQYAALRLAPRDAATLGRLQASRIGRTRPNGDIVIPLGGGVSQFHDVRWALTDAGVRFDVCVDGLLVDQRSLPPARPRPGGEPTSDQAPSLEP